MRREDVPFRMPRLKVFGGWREKRRDKHKLKQGVLKRNRVARERRKWRCVAEKMLHEHVEGSDEVLLSMKNEVGQVTE